MMMMMVREAAGSRHHTGSAPPPPLAVPPWPFIDELSLSSAGGDCSPYFIGDGAALHRYLPSNDAFVGGDEDGGDELELVDAPIDAYSCDDFRMFEFKVRRCARGRSHDWTECPYAHPGEKARRRDPQKYNYSGAACPDFRKGGCKRGDGCEFAHGVFECWLHPARYRTQPCKDGTACRRRVCFFAHTPEQLRVLPQSPPPQQQQHSPKSPIDSYDGSPLRHHHHALDSCFTKNLFSSPTSTLQISGAAPISTPSDSPPMTPVLPAVRRGTISIPAAAAMDEVFTSLKQLQLSKAKSAQNVWGSPLGSGMLSPGSGCLRSPSGTGRSASIGASSVLGSCSSWHGRWGGFGAATADEPVQAVESGRLLREKMLDRLCKENGLDRGAAEGGSPDVGWVSELVM